MGTKTTTSKKPAKANSFKQQKRGLTAVSLFAGAGGLDIAASQTGEIERLFSTDSNETFLRSLINNMPTHFPEIQHDHLVADAHKLGSDLIQECIGTSKVDLIIGGPPCDDFTSTGMKRGALGDKAPLIFQYSRIIRELRPEAFLFENVPNLMKMCGAFFDDLLGQFNDCGYTLKTAILNASDFGAPSIRKRLFVAGFKNRKLANCFKFPQATHGVSQEQESLFKMLPEASPYLTVRDVLFNLPDPSHTTSELHLNHTARIHRPKTIEHFKSIPQGVAVNKSYRYRAPWMGQCRSLTAGLDNSAKAYIHPIYHREMTVREYARIHGFPDTWKFSGTFDNGLKQVANAVPIPLGSAVLNELVCTIIGRSNHE